MIKNHYLSPILANGVLTCSSLPPFSVLKTEEITSIHFESNIDISWLDPNKPIVALTFDDGPVSNSTSAFKILDTLEEYNAHATFFYCGASINAESEAEIKRAYEMGNEIGNHTTHHKDLTKLSKIEILSEVDSTAELLTDITGLEQFLVRPPYLSTNDIVLSTISSPLISASLDSGDWRGIDAETIISNVLNHIEDGAIILMHETLDTTAEAVKALLPILIERDYQVASVSEMMSAKGVILTSGKIYTHHRLDNGF